MAERIFKYSRGKFKIEPSTIEKAEYSPWGRIFNRIENVCDVVATLSMKVKFGEIEAIEPLFYALTELFDHLLPLTTKEIEEKFWDQIKKIKEELEKWKTQVKVTRKPTYPEKLVNDLQDLKRNLLILKQSVGLGIPTTKEEVEEEKLKRILGLKR